jgi:pheromone shutdown-related protein TraB
LQVTIDDRIIVVGTAHISQKSVDEVKAAIQMYKPDVVAVELCQRRYDGLTKKDVWENTPVTKLIKSNNAYFLLAQTFLGSIQRKLGKDHGVEPGSEMIAAINDAKKEKIPVELLDRDIAITLKRAWKHMGFREKMRILWEFMKAMVGFDEDELDEIDFEELMDQDMISTMMEEFGQIAPSVTKVLINERDMFIAQNIKNIAEDGKKVVAVVGAGHLKGIESYLRDTEFSVDLKELETLPKKRVPVFKILGYLIPVLFAILIGYAFFYKGFEFASMMFVYWFLINGICSAIGTAIARGHPLSILTAFVAAPITSLNPAIAAGWVAGYVEAKLRTPLIKDFKQLSNIESFKDFWNNRVVRLLLVVALANLGSMIGTVIAFPYLTSLLTG